MCRHYIVVSLQPNNTAPRRRVLTNGVGIARFHIFRYTCSSGTDIVYSALTNGAGIMRLDNICATAGQHARSTTARRRVLANVAISRFRNFAVSRFRGFTFSGVRDSAISRFRGVA